LRRLRESCARRPLADAVALPASLLAAACQIGRPLGDQILFGQSMPTSPTALAGAPDSLCCFELSQQDEDLIGLAVGAFGELGRREPVVLAQYLLQHLGGYDSGAPRAVGLGTRLRWVWL